MPIARRGEVWQVDLGLAAKVRPAVILNIPFQDHERAVYTVVPHTTAIRGTRFEVELEVGGLEHGAFDAQGIRNIPGTVLIQKRVALTPEQMAAIEQAVKLWLGL